VGTTVITLAGQRLEDTQPFDLRIAVETTINIGAQAARRKVTGWLVDQVGNMLIGGKPQLVISQQTLWRVPVLLTSSVSGVVGEVGTVDVDVMTGKLNVNNKLRKQILDNVKHIASPASTSDR
jgi:cytochrome c-type biogenesis protein CcmH/NrfF